MKNECSIVKDLLPLYAEKMVSGDTAAFVEEHCKSCASCQAALDGMRETGPRPGPDDPAPLRPLRRRLKAMRVQTVAFTALFVTALLVSLAAALGAPIYAPYSPELVTGGIPVRGNADGFTGSVTGGISVGGNADEFAGSITGGNVTGGNAGNHCRSRRDGMDHDPFRPEFRGSQQAFGRGGAGGIGLRV